MSKCTVLTFQLVELCVSILLLHCLVVRSLSFLLVFIFQILLIFQMVALAYDSTVPSSGVRMAGHTFKGTVDFSESSSLTETWKTGNQVLSITERDKKCSGRGIPDFSIGDLKLALQLKLCPAPGLNVSFPLTLETKAL